MGFRGVSARDDGYATVRLVVLHHAVLEGEKGPIAAHAHILARMQLGAALTDDDRAREDRLAAETFHTEPLCFAGATVA